MKRDIPMDILKKMYYEKRMSLRQIAPYFNVNYQTILNRMEEYGLPRRNSGEHKRGVPHTKEHRDKISKSLKGKKHSYIRKRRISKSKIGISSPLKGLRKETHPDKIKCGCCKENHWNWKGGISDENIRIRQSSKYKTWRDKVFKRDNFTCKDCGVRGTYLQAHHIKPFSKYKELRFDIDNGITLCLECHKKKRRNKKCQLIQKKK